MVEEVQLLERNDWYDTVVGFYGVDHVQVYFDISRTLNSVYGKLIPYSSAMENGVNISPTGLLSEVKDVGKGVMGPNLGPSPALIIDAAKRYAIERGSNEGLLALALSTESKLNELEKLAIQEQVA